MAKNKGVVFAPRVTNHPAMVVNKTAKHAPNTGAPKAIGSVPAKVARRKQAR